MSYGHLLLAVGMSIYMLIAIRYEEKDLIGYFGREADAAPSVAPSWRDQWNDTQRLPLLIRIDVAPKAGPPWPTLYVAPREAPEAGCRAWDVAREHWAAV